MDVVGRAGQHRDVAGAHDAVLDDLELGVERRRSVVHAPVGLVEQSARVDAEEVPAAVVVRLEVHARGHGAAHDADVAVVVDPSEPRLGVVAHGVHDHGVEPRDGEEVTHRRVDRVLFGEDVVADLVEQLEDASCTFADRTGHGHPRRRPKFRRCPGIAGSKLPGCSTAPRSCIRRWWSATVTVRWPN